MSRPKRYGAVVSREVVTVWGPDEITLGVVRDLNFRTALGLSGHSGSVRWGAGAESAFDGYLADAQHFVGEAGGGTFKADLADAGLPATSAPANFMSPMQALLGELGH